MSKWQNIHFSSFNNLTILKRNLRTFGDWGFNTGTRLLDWGKIYKNISLLRWPRIMELHSGWHWYSWRSCSRLQRTSSSHHAEPAQDDDTQQDPAESPVLETTSSTSGACRSSRPGRILWDENYSRNRYNLTHVHLINTCSLTTTL